jgi:hypothetical protein
MSSVIIVLLLLHEASSATTPSSSRMTTATLMSSVTATASASSVVADPTAVAAGSGGGGNVVFQLAGYVKDSMVRMVDGTKEMWTNHGRCNEIRTKQKIYRERLKKQWELEEHDMSAKDMRQRLAKINGGISYDEYDFLIRGKEDRGKLMNMMFLMWGAPRFFPYAMMFFPDILPSAFAPLPDASGKETKLEKLSRIRSHAVIKTLLAMENEAKTIPVLGKINVFGKKAQARRMDEIDSLAKTVGQIMTTTKGTSSDTTPGIILNTMEEFLYKTTPFSRAEQRLVNVPKCITSGFMSALPMQNLSPVISIMPNFLKRGQILNHIQKVSDVDNFLVGEKVNVQELSKARLLEACIDRMIDVPGRSEEELRRQLLEWLNLAVIQPIGRTQQTGEFYNENLGRLALMSHYSIIGARDDRSASYLPRFMLQGQSRPISLAQAEEMKNRKR